MKQLLPAVLLCLSATVFAQEAQGPAIGVILGEPTGVSGKLWLSPTEAIDGAAAWSFGNHDAFQLHADYLLHRYDAFYGIDPRYGKLPLYFGIGARFKSDGAGKHDEDSEFGIRVPVGVTYLFAQVPFDVFGELVPVFDLAPSTTLRFNAAIGARFYFDRRRELAR